MAWKKALEVLMVGWGNLVAAAFYGQRTVEEDDRSFQEQCLLLLALNSHHVVQISGFDDSPKLGVVVRGKYMESLMVKYKDQVNIV
jgi:hypothetical protein